MSDEETNDTTETEDTTEAAPPKGKSEMFSPTATPGTPTAPPALLTRGSDLAARPGFRSPSNKNSKVQRADKKKKK